LRGEKGTYDQREGLFFTLFLSFSSLFKEKDFVFLTISVDYEGKKPVKEFIEKRRYTFPVLLDDPH
jgi:hypothetical protein